MSDHTCYHCGLDCGKNPVEFNGKCFCCNGCKTVYEILNQNELSCYYDFEQTPGSIPKEIQGKFDYLDNPEIADQLIEFSDGTTNVVEFYIPSIHCSACIWVLENLEKLNPAIVNSMVNFPNKTVRINYKAKETSLKEIVELLTSIAYEPYISLEDSNKSAKKLTKPSFINWLLPPLVLVILCYWLFRNILKRETIFGLPILNPCSDG